MTRMMYVGNTATAVLLGAKVQYKPKSIISEALDGSVYIQTPAIATTRYEVNVYCDTPAKRDAVDGASNDGSLIKIDMLDGTQKTGYIDGRVVWKEWLDGHGVGKFTMIAR